jgi:hypothetical protein
MAVRPLNTVLLPVDTDLKVGEQTQKYNKNYMVTFLK